MESAPSLEGGSHIQVRLYYQFTKNLQNVLKALIFLKSRWFLENETVLKASFLYVISLKKRGSLFW